MLELESTTIRNRTAGALEIELCSFTPTEAVTHYTNGARAILGMLLPPYPQRRKARYSDMGKAFSNIGNIILTPPGADCQFSGGNSRSFAFRCYFDEATFRRVTGTPDVLSEGLLMKTLDISGSAGARIDFLLRQMVREMEVPGFASETLIEGLGLSALAHLARYLHDTEQDAAPVRGRLSPAQLRRLEHVVESVRGRAPTITDLAAECGIGPRRFTTLFRETTGQTVKVWVDSRRMDLARKLLAETDLPLKVIAFDLGFANQSVFSTAFRLRSAMSPSEYRRGLRYAL
jgi:AraC family transcriptional regulator